MMIPVFILNIEDDSDRAFMEYLYIEHRSTMFKTAMRILRHKEDAEDVVQAACLSLCKKISLLRTLECNTLRSYVVISIKNFAINLLRNRGRKPELLWGDTDYCDSLLNGQNAVQEDPIFNFDQDLLNSAIIKLPQRERHLLEKKYVLQFSDEEIAKDFGVKPASVRVMLMRTKQRLRTLVEEICNEESSL